MTLTIDLTTEEETRLQAQAKAHGVDEKKFVHDMISRLPPVPPTPAERQEALIALLDQWLEEDATDDPELIRQAEEELAEMKSNMNANRAATGERLVFP